MTNETWQQWNQKWNWIIDIAKIKQWWYKDIEILPTISLSELESLETNAGRRFPKDFKGILENYAGGVIMGWQIGDTNFEGEFKSIFSGAGGFHQSTDPYLWNFHDLSRIHEVYIGWITNCYDDPNDDYGKHYYDKTPFLEVPNGDLIAFNDMENVVYLSHDDGPLHGAKLADSFEEFISLWTNIACIGTESEQLQVLYDFQSEKLLKNGDKKDRWMQLFESEENSVKQSSKSNQQKSWWKFWS